MSGKRNKLWTPAFSILWQSQLVSTLGDAVYSIALGFWILAATGSTSLMGTLMAVSTLPGVLISPFAGVFIDRYDKKKLLILMDMIRGICILAVAAAAYGGLLAIWMVFAAGIILSVCGAVFRPGVNSSIPDLVDKTKLSNANSLFSIVFSGANMLGNVSGGILFQAFGAPLLFLVNGISYFFSGLSIVFVKIPRKVIVQEEDRHIMEDMKEGFRFMWNRKGLRYILLMVAILNFFSNVAIILFLPYFKQTSYLGAQKYGIAMACFMGGAMLGFLLFSILSIRAEKRLRLFFLSMVVFLISTITAFNVAWFPIMIGFLLIGGFFNSIVNVIIISKVQEATPEEMRGKVMAFMSMTSQGLTPAAMALGGILAEVIPIRFIVNTSFMLIFLVIFPFYFMKSFRDFLNLAD